MSTTLVLHSRTDLGGGHVELQVDIADVSEVGADDFEFIVGLVDAIGNRALATDGQAVAVVSPPAALPPAPSPATKPTKSAAKRSPKPPPQKTNGVTARSRGNSDLGVRMLRQLHDLGGEIFDPSGRAATQLFTAVGCTEVNQQTWARSVLKTLAEAGHITRAVSGKRTTRVALQASGLAIVDGDEPPAASLVSVDVTEVDNDPPVATSETKGFASDCLHGAHRLCAVARARCSCPCHNGKAA